MITEHDAYHEDEFHVSRDGHPCAIWHRQGLTHTAPGGGWLVFILADNGDWHHITGVNAGDFHTPGACPRSHDGQPPARTVHTAPFAGLEDGYDEDGYDEDGYDEDGYDRDGRDEDGCNRDGCDASELDLAELWSTHTPCNPWPSSAGQREFRDHLRALVSNPDEIDALAFCDSCGEPGWDEDMNSVQGGSASVCESCWDDMVTCDSCEERFATDDIYGTLCGSSVCRNCRYSYYSWCDECDGYYQDEYADDHEHNSGDGCCEVLATTFSVRNDGEDPLKNDTRVTVTLPAGTISSEGMQAIARYLRDQGHFNVSYDLDELGDQWQTRGGNYTKRLSRLAYQKYQAKMTQDVLSTVGTIARNHSTAVDVAIEVTRELNMPAYEFYHEGSCWWGSYGESRCVLKTNGGFGLRSFDSSGGVSGRAWVMPLRKDEHGKLVPTFETMTPDAFVVFNGYGDLSGYAPARIVAHMAGWTYRKISFSADPMYVNAGGYLIASEDIAAPYTDGGLYLSVRQHSRLFETETETAVRELVNA